MVVTPQECAKLTPEEEKTLDELVSKIDAQLLLEGIGADSGEVCVNLPDGFVLNCRMASAFENRYIKSGWTAVEVISDDRQIKFEYDLSSVQNRK